jgi:hypothetical protein
MQVDLVIFLPPKTHMTASEVTKRAPPRRHAEGGTCSGESCAPRGGAWAPMRLTIR